MLNSVLSRRDLLAALGAAGIAGLRSPSWSSWRVPAFARVGVQLYTVRSVLSRDVPGTLTAIAAMGYREVETAGYANVSPRDFRHALDAAGLVSPAAHVDLRAIDTGLDQALANCATVGHRWLVVPSLPGSVRTVDGYKKVGETFAKAAAAAKPAGVRIAYHNHDVDFAPIGGTTGMALIMESSPAGVAAELDVYWIVKAGHDPFAFIDTHKNRVKMLHLKDASAGPERAMRDVGAGSIDWARVLRHAEAAGVEHVFVEHDSPGDALRSVKTSFDFLSSIGHAKGRP